MSCDVTVRGVSGGHLADTQANGLLATQSVAISPVSPVYDHHHHHHHHHQQQQHQYGGAAVVTPRQMHVNFSRSSPSSMLGPAWDADGSPDDDTPLTPYAATTALDGLSSPASTLPVPVATAPLVGRPSPCNSAVQLIDYVPAPGPAYAGHLAAPVRGDIYRPISSAATADPYTPAAGDMYRAFSMPTLKSELI